MDNLVSLAHRCLWRSTCALIIVLSVTACGSDRGSADLGELRALWLVDANRDTQGVNVAARVIESSEISIPAGFELPAYDKLFSLEEIDPAEALLFPQYYGVRLTEGDVMYATTAGGRKQLYRREADFIYRTNYALENETSAVELSLNYVGGRFPTAISNVRVFAVDGLTVAEAADLVPMDGTINLSWNVGDVTAPTGSELSQHLLITLLGCSSGSATTETMLALADSVLLDIPSDLRATTIPVSDLPMPEPISDASPVANAVPPCVYRFQVIVKLAPSAERLNPMIDPQAAEAEDVTPLVTLLNRTASVQVEVENDSTRQR